MNKNDYFVYNIIWLYFIEAKYDVTSDKNIGFKSNLLKYFLCDSDVLVFTDLNIRFAKRLSKHKTLKMMQCKRQPKSSRIC